MHNFFELSEFGRAEETICVSRVCMDTMYYMLRRMCCDICAHMCICIWQSKASDEYTTHSASVCVSVLVCWWRTLWSSHYMCYNCRFTIGLSQPIQCVCPHSIHIRSIAQLGSMREKNGMERKKAAAAQHTQRSAVVKHQQCTKRRESARVVSECEPRFMYHSVWRM